MIPLAGLPLMAVLFAVYRKYVPLVASGRMYGSCSVICGIVSGKSVARTAGPVGAGRGPAAFDGRRTSTTNDRDERLPAASCAVTLTVVRPSRNCESGRAE